jgi:hypothetical protein
MKITLFNIFSAAADPVPEPASSALLGSVLLLAVIYTRLKKSKTATSSR